MGHRVHWLSDRLLSRVQEKRWRYSHTEAGLARAMRYRAEEWLEELRGQIAVVAAGGAPELSFAWPQAQQHNHDTVF